MQSDYSLQQLKQTVYCYKGHCKLAIGLTNFLAKVAKCFVVVYTVGKDFSLILLCYYFWSVFSI